ncbi:MAG: phosphate-starvation-inducible PsiE family protein [Solirubrobacteraceae bacterium]|jgi:uncharacterized membrane protein (DUF373 family)
MDEGQERLARVVRGSLVGVEEALYVIVGVLLLGAAVLIVVGGVRDVVVSIEENKGAVSIGVTLLDRILLTLIVAELLHTLRHVIMRGEIVVEPFLFVGLIAVVRRILIVTAQLEGSNVSTHQLIELGLLGLLTLAIAIAIYLVRRSESSSSSRLPPPDGGGPTPLAT